MTPQRFAARLVAHSLQPWFWWLRLVGDEVAELAIQRNRRDQHI